MLTGQKVLGIVIILFTIGSGIFFTVNKFKSEVTNISASPSSSPAALEFLFNTNATPVPSGGVQQPAQTPTQTQVSQRPYFINKNVGKFPGVLNEDSLKNSAGEPSKKVVIETNKGNIEIEIFTDTPITSSNFLLLADGGFYDGLKFHRVENWVIQGGDPLGNGTGGPGYLFADEAVNKAYTKSIAAMANAGPNTNGSQFFILKTDYPLPPNYTIFGSVILGMDVVEKIKVGDIMQKVTVQPLK